jgi:hypothetical protein
MDREAIDTPLMATHESAKSFAVTVSCSVNEFAIRALGHRCARDGSRGNLFGMQPRSNIE